MFVAGDFMELAQAEEETQHAMVESEGEANGNDANGVVDGERE